MGTLLICTLVGTAALIFLTQIRKSEIVDKIMLPFVGACLGLLLGVCIACVIGSKQPLVWQLESQTKLASLRGETGTSGDLFLGTGSIGTTYVVSYFTMDESGGYLPHILRTSEQIAIFETDDIEAVFEIFKTVPASSKNQWSFLVPKWKMQKYYKFTVPRGTVKTSFNVQ